MDYFDKTYHPPGTPPGTLTIDEISSKEELNIRLIDFTSSKFAEIELATTDECLP